MLEPRPKDHKAWVHFGSWGAVTTWVLQPESAPGKINLRGPGDNCLFASRVLAGQGFLPAAGLGWRDPRESTELV